MDIKSITAYIFNSGELEALLDGAFPEKNKLSPLSGDARTGAAKPALSEEKLKLRENDDFQTAASILCDPQFRVSAIKGGGCLDEEKFDLLGRADGGETRWDVLLKNETLVAVLYFINTAGLCEWFADTFGVKTDLPMNNLLESGMTPEEWVVVAHAVDSFRRAYMESMLLYKPSREYSIDARDFIASLNVAVDSGDTRWLLPAFFAVTPGLSGLKPDLKPEVFQIIETIGLVKHSRNPETNEGAFAFTTKGMTLGLEFATSWMYGVGLRAAVLDDEDQTALPACFLAPTSLGNHLFTVEKTEARGLFIRHSALTHTELDKSFAEWTLGIVDRADYVKRHKAAEKTSAAEPSSPEVIPDRNGVCLKEGNDDSVQAAGSIKPSETPKPADAVKWAEPAKPAQPAIPAIPSQPAASAQTPVARFCMKCGNKISPGARFCSKCGSRAG